MMNERINELAIKAGGIWRGGYVEQPNGDSVWTDRKFVVDVDTEQFAELIVRECIGCCEQVISDPVPKSVDTWLNGGSQCIDQIKEHFGVEE
jgi:hypothetical protein